MNIGTYIAGGLSLLLLVVVLVLSGENTILKKNLENCSKDLAAANAGKALRDELLEEQNSRVDQDGAISERMRQNQDAALADAEKEIAELESQIDLIRSRPPAADCEAVRVQMIKNVVQI
jgi:hypothetical protein